MQLKNFPIQNGNSYCVRGGDAMIDLEIDSSPALTSGSIRTLSAEGVDKFRTGKLGMYESGELLKDWRVRVTESGTVFCNDDDFYRALDLFASLTGR